ncbi:SecDF P1 head subdomain-containing protein [Streptomyces sp. NBC_01643]|uniref:SecDF P1 head subdomain-containing protein n=1 Tax=Streptomyces sp. NBC_01643 TaxID=2975906 RepID=UPI002F90FCF6|nr:hypothetical protein OHB03_46455 [Streptomyces sp. NBC_01643]WTD39896.1 hypothetical protein OHB03_49695 [Streptomyces sp. NBC_01643]
MNDSTEHPLHDTLLHDALHALVRESGGNAAGPYLVGLADGALRVARRRRRLARAGVGIAAAVVATAGVVIADGATQHPDVVQPAAQGTGNTEKAALISILPVTRETEHACAQGSGGYTLHATAYVPAYCVHVDQAKGMTDVHVTSAKADKSSIYGAWGVEVTLNSADRTRFAALTGSISANRSPLNQFGIFIDGKLWSTPMVKSSLTGGRLYIYGASVGDLTSATAHDLAHKLDPGK